MRERRMVGSSPKPFVLSLSKHPPHKRALACGTGPSTGSGRMEPGTVIKREGPPGFPDGPVEACCAVDQKAILIAAR